MLQREAPGSSRHLRQWGWHECLVDQPRKILVSKGLLRARLFVLRWLGTMNHVSLDSRRCVQK